MEHNRVGRSTMSVSKICLGTMHIGPKPTRRSPTRSWTGPSRWASPFSTRPTSTGPTPARAGRRRSSARGSRPGPASGRGRPGHQGVPPMGDLGLATTTRGSPRTRSAAPRRVAAPAADRSDRSLPGATTSTSRSRRGAVGHLRTRGGRRRRALCRREQPLRLGAGQAPDAGMASAASSASSPNRTSTTCSPGARDGGVDPRPRIRHRGAGLHAVGGGC